MKNKTTNGWTKETMKKRVRDRVLTKSCAPGLPSICLYRSRTADGRENCCVAGAFIEDKYYCEKMEEQSIGFLMNDVTSLRHSMPLYANGMEALQAVHDRLRADADAAETICSWIDENVVDA